MNLITTKKAGKEYRGWTLFLVLATAILMFASDLFAQDYTVSLRQRRLGDQIGVEVWLKSNTTTAPRLGNMSISVVYNSTELVPDPALTSAQVSATDSVDYDCNQSGGVLPYRQIASPFSGVNNYSSLTFRATSLDDGTYPVFQLDVNLPRNATGFQPSMVGRGSFVGMLRFNIMNPATLDVSKLSNVEINTAVTTVGDFVIFSDASVNMESSTNFITTPAFAIRGITILNPNGPNEALNRYKQYPALSVIGYPIYFERSGMITPTNNTNCYGTNACAYTIDYSLNNGSTWTTDALRVVETNKTLQELIDNGESADYYRSGAITTTTGTNAGYTITQADGNPLPVPQLATNYRGILRTIWAGDRYYPYRSEQALLRVVQVTGSAAALVTARTRTTGTTYTYDVSDYPFILSRLFFAQLGYNGLNDYLRTRDNFSNPTQLTLEAWVNLNDLAPVSTAQPGILACGPGGTNPNEEGPWILYLDRGVYPAFRCKEIYGGAGRGENGSAYIATVVSPDALVATSDAAPINDNLNHPDNWAHIAVTVANNVVCLYVNGELKIRKTNTNANNIRMATQSHPVWIGVNPIGGIQAGDYLHAGIKEVRVWRNALTQEQIRTYAAGVATPSTWVDPNIRSSLELYYDFQGSSADLATATMQNGVNPIYYYTTPDQAAVSPLSIRYRPDRGHIRLLSPTGGEGISNMIDQNFEVRWIGYGIGDAGTAASEDLVVEFRRQGGTDNDWKIGIDNTWPGNLLNKVEIEAANASWMPYHHATISGAMDDLQNVIPEASQYSKQVQLRIRGTEAHNQQDLSFTSGYFNVAPYFALNAINHTQLVVPAGTEMNLTGSVAVFEAWIKPYSLPSSTYGFYPIIDKTDGTTGHYTFRLLSSGRLYFAVTKADGSLAEAYSDVNHPLIAPNYQVFDTLWYHVAVYANLNRGNASSVRFYIDGIASPDSISGQLQSGVFVNQENTLPTNIAFEPGVTPSDAHYFFGEIKEIRYWNGLPGNLSATGNEPTELTKFIQGASSVRANDLTTVGTINYQKNLVAAFSLNGGAFIQSGIPYNCIKSSVGNLYAQILVNDGLSFTGVRPFIKLVEPVFQQRVTNTTTNLLVRWVGFDYDENQFHGGDAGTGTDSDLEHSILGGGGITVEPYNFTASTNDNAAFITALTFPDNNRYRFEGTVPPYSQYAGMLNVSTAKSVNDLTQAPLSATISNARLRLRGRSTLTFNSPYEYTDFRTLRTEGPVFTITPASNFSVRVLLEGLQRGSASAMPNNLGDSYLNNGITIKLFKNDGGRPGKLISTQSSPADGYYRFDLGLTNADNRFGIIPFVIDTINDDNYFVAVFSQNHLPVMSRYNAPFAFVGDDLSTLKVESGWDFTRWTGISTNVLPEIDALADPGINYTAYGNSEFNSTKTEYGSTGLHYNDGQDGTSIAPIASMVAGDVVHDGQINADDRVKVRSDYGTSNKQSNVTNTGMVNAIDRDLTDRNNGIVSSIGTLGIGTSFAPKNKNAAFSAVSDINPAMSEILNAEAKAFIENGSVRQAFETKKGNLIMSTGVKYKVTGEGQLNVDNQEIRMSVYVQNIGESWAPGNCTFAMIYDPNSLEFSELAGTDGSLWSKIPEKGYVGAIATGPELDNPDAIPNVRTIEIDYDGFTRKIGNNVPYERTLVGTLVFKIKLPLDQYDFSWHSGTALLRTNGVNVTNNGIFEDIKSVNAYTPLTVTSPNGGEVLKSGHFVLDYMAQTKQASKCLL